MSKLSIIISFYGIWTWPNYHWAGYVHGTQVRFPYNGNELQFEIDTFAIAAILKPESFTRISYSMHFLVKINSKFIQGDTKDAIDNLLVQMQPNCLQPAWKKNQIQT